MLVRPGSSRLWKSRWGAGIPANKLSRFTKMRNCPSVEVSTVEGLYNGRVNDHALYSTAPMTRSQFEMEISWNERVSTLLRLWNLDYWRFHSCASSRTDRWYCWRYMNFGRNDPYLREIRALPEDAYLPLGDRASICAWTASDVILISGRNEPVLAERSAYPAGKLLLD